MPILHDNKIRTDDPGYVRANRCQVNVGTDEKPKSCGEPLKFINSWTWECRKHGEVH